MQVAQLPMGRLTEQPSIPLHCSYTPLFFFPPCFQHATSFRGSYESDDLWRNAGALASAAPWAVPLAAVHVQLLGGSVNPQQLPRLLNGTLVGLLRTTPPHLHHPNPHPGHPHGNAWDGQEAQLAEAASAAYPPGGVSYAGTYSQPPPLLPCVGVGLVRAVDVEAGTAYVLTDVPGEVLQGVDVLCVGRLELPVSLLVGGEVATPYQALFGLSAEATGAGAAKARKNLSRSSLVELAG